MPTLTETAERLRDQLRNDGLTRRWAQHPLNADGLKPVRGPADVIGEQRLNALQFLITQLPEDRIYNFTGEPIDQRELGIALASAVPFWWHPQVYDLLRASPLPKHIISADLLPYETVWWTYESEIPTTIMTPLVVGPDGQQHTNVRLQYDLQGRLIERKGERIRVTHFGLKDQLPFIFVSHFRTGTAYPSDHLLRLDEVTIVLQHMAFMNSPFVESVRVRQQNANKGQRKRLNINEVPAIQVVRLRAAEAEPTTEGDVLHRTVNWHNRWLVRGHYRAQWYASTATHKVIWIAPHLKGPEDAPLKTPVYAVIR